MDSYKRLWPYVKPHAGMLALSVLFAVLLAALWTASLSAAHPIIKVLLEKQTLQSWVAGEIETAEGSIAKYAADITELDAEIAALDAATDSREQAQLAASRESTIGRQSYATQKLATMRWVEYRVLPWVPDGIFRTFALLMGLVLASTVLRSVCLFCQEFIIGRVVESILQAIRVDCLDHALRLDYATTSGEGVSTLMSRFTFDAQQMATGLQMLSGRLIREPLKAVSCVCLAMYLNWRLAVVTMLFVPLLAIVIHQCARLIKRAMTRMMASMETIYKQLEETFTGLETVTAYNARQRHVDGFEAAYAGYFEKSLKVVKLQAILRPLSEVIMTLAVCTAMLPCGYLVLSGETNIWGIKLAPEPMDAAGVVALYAALAGLLDPMQKLSKVYSRLKKAGAAIDRVFDLLDKRPRFTDPAQPREMPAVAEAVEFKNLRFGYPLAESDAAAQDRGLVLNGLDLSIPAGECVAIVGENGCGKSTLVNLLPRFYDPDGGEILIDGVPLPEVEQFALREKIAIVSQSTNLFDATIRENIAYGRESATASDVERAAEEARVTEFASQMPLGLETPVGERGSGLSGGQRQRIALARAMLRDPRLLILDEATSAIDSRSEAAIHEALETFTRGRTTLIITHDMSPTLQRLVDRVVVLSAGRVESIGTPEQVAADSPTYRRLFRPLPAAA